MNQKNCSLQLLLLMVLFCFPVMTTLNSASAQQSTQQSQSPKMKGNVVDETGSPLPGVSVKVDGTSNGTITDLYGNFNLALPAGKNAITVSYIGYTTQKVVITGNGPLKIKLQPDQKSLEEVVVVGYGTRKAKDLTGNIATVSSRDFEKAPVTNAEALIASKISGVQVVPSGGKPGSGSSFLIQGGASLSAANDPLIVIDGMPLEGANGGPGILSQLNPNDIENFTVLKDASASAIYGSRASNGVILITTKKGNKGKMAVDFSVNTRLSTLRDKVPVLNADQYRTLASELGSSMRTAPGTASTDWQDEIFQNAFAQDYNLSVSGSVNKLPYRVSGSYTNQDGILKTGNYERATASLNMNPSFLKDQLKVNFNLKGAYENERIANSSAIWAATTFDPTQPVHVDDQTYGGYFQYADFRSNPALVNLNPVSMLEQVNERNKNYRAMGNIQADYSFWFMPELHLNVNGGLDMSRSQYTYQTPATYFGTLLNGGNVYNGDPSKEVFNKIFESYLFYSKDLKQANSKFDLTAGYSYSDFTTTNYNYKTYSESGLVVSTPKYDFDKPSHSIVSFYGRANYTFMDKYLLTASLRDDASSRFAEKHRWGLFPSMALAWKAKEESFLKDVKVLSDLKVRAGYGITGQQDGLDNYYHLPTYYTNNNQYQYNVGPNAYYVTLPAKYNPDLRWEQTATTNIGIDYGFFDHRITGSLNVYDKKTKDLLNEVTIPYGYSYDDQLIMNIGSMENKGVEFNVKAIALQTKDFSWDLSFNATYNQNKITKLSLIDNNSVGLSSDNVKVNTIGYARNTYYLYHQVYDENGKPIEDQMLDVNNDGLINEKDRYVSGKSALPKYLLGFNTNFQYRKWSAGASMHANLGHYIYYVPQENSVAMTGWTTSQNLNTSYYQSQFKNSNQYQGYSDYYLQNASFLKMDNAYIGYDFGKIVRNSGISLKMNVSVQNIFTITRFTGLDPESNSGTQNAYPVPRTFAFGLNMSF